MYAIEIDGCEFGVCDGRDADPLYLSRDPRPPVRVANRDLTPAEAGLSLWGQYQTVAEIVAVHKARQWERDVLRERCDLWSLVSERLRTGRA